MWHSLPFLLLLLSATQAAQCERPSNCTQATFNALLSATQAATGSLKAAAAAAPSQRPGLDTSREAQVVELAGMYTAFAGVDFGSCLNTSSVGAAVAGWLAKSRAKADAEAFAAAVPCGQLATVKGIVEDASAQLEEALDASKPLRKAVPGGSLPSLSPKFSPKDGLLYAADGRPVFPVGTCGYSCFMPLSTSQVAALSAAGPISQHSWVGATLVTLVVPPSGGALPTVNTTEVDRIVAAAKLLVGANLPVHLYLRQHPMPSWLPPASTAGDAKQTADFNLDTDVVLDAWGVGLGALLPALAALTPNGTIPTPWSVMVANEAYAGKPATVGTPPGNASLLRFQAFLRDTYGGNVSALNAAWNATFSSFASVSKYPSTPNGITASTSAVASFADYTLWLHNRTSWFFGRLMDDCRQDAPNLLFHVKNKNYGSWGPFNNGFDRYAIAKHGGMVGVDTRDMPGVASWTKVTDKYWHPGHWASDWRAPAVSYTYMRSLGTVSAASPGAVALYGQTQGPTVRLPVFDSETHYTSVSAARVLDSVAFDHGRGSLLLASVAGLGLSSAWYWDRNTDGSLVDTVEPWGPGWSGTAGVAGCDAMQPGAVGGRAAASRDLATAGAVVSSILDPSTRAGAAMCHLRCDAGRYLSNTNVSMATLELFTAAALSSVRDQVFVLDAQLAEWGSAALSSCGAVTIPACNYAADAVVDALREWATGGGLLVVTPAQPGAAPDSTGYAFGRTDRGVARPQSELAFLGSASTLLLSNAVDMAHRLDALLTSHGVGRAVVCQPVGSVICRWARSGNHTVGFVYNPRAYNSTVTFETALEGTLVDASTGFPWTSLASAVTLAPEEARLVVLES